MYEYLFRDEIACRKWDETRIQIENVLWNKFKKKFNPKYFDSDSKQFHDEEYKKNLEMFKYLFAMEVECNAETYLWNMIYDALANHVVDEFCMDGFGEDESQFVRKIMETQSSFDGIYGYDREVSLNMNDPLISDRIKLVPFTKELVESYMESTFELPINPRELGGCEINVDCYAYYPSELLSSFVFAIIGKDDGELIGSIELNQRGVVCSLSFLILPQYAGKGYVEEAVNAVIKRSKEDFFYQLSLDDERLGIIYSEKACPFKCLQVNVDEANDHFNELLKAMGFTKTGIKHFSKYMEDGEYATENVYELIV